MDIRTLRKSDYPRLGIPPLPDNATGWVLCTPRLIGYIACAPLPGLPHLADLYGEIASTARRQGYGTFLLKHLLLQLESSQIKQLATPCTSLTSNVAQFLLAHNFYQEHTEIELEHRIRLSTDSPQISVRRLSIREGADELRHLYDASFDGLKWYQPYVNADEVVDDLGPQGEVWFLMDDNRPIGFAGLRFEVNHVDIEPFGILPEYQRKGLGRQFMSTVLQTLAHRHIYNAQLTVWEDNDAAMKLYQSLGFTPLQQRIYLARDLP